MVKAYLSKSNQANPDDVLRVREALLNEGFSIQEFTGGTYSNVPLLNSDILVLVLPGPPAELRSGEPDYLIGKGQFEQIEDFARWRGKEDVHNNIFVACRDNQLLGQLFRQVNGEKPAEAIPGYAKWDAGYAKVNLTKEFRVRTNELKKIAGLSDTEPGRVRVSEGKVERATEPNLDWGDLGPKPDLSKISVKKNPPKIVNLLLCASRLF